MEIINIFLAVKWHILHFFLTSTDKIINHPKSNLCHSLSLSRIERLWDATAPHAVLTEDVLITEDNQAYLAAENYGQKF